MSKIVYLLGAGATIPFLQDSNGVLDTTRLNKVFFNENKWKVVINKFNHFASKSDWGIQIDFVEVIEVIGKIKTIIQDKKNINFTRNFEGYIHFLDKISDVKSIYNSKEWGTFDSLLIEFFQNTTITGNSYWEYVPFLARELIISEIILIWDSNKKNEEAINIYYKHFKDLHQFFNSINIYSLNYDPLVYQGVKGLSQYCTGFEQNNNRFNKSTFLKANNVVSFLHGHIGFFPATNFGYELRDDYLNIQEERLKKSCMLDIRQTKITQKGMKGTHYNTFLVTGFDKFEAFTLNPFSSYYHRFAVDLFHCDYIVLIGVSLQDIHLNTFLQSALKVSEKNIIWVNKYDFEDVKRWTLEKSGNSDLLKIQMLWGDERTVKNNGTSKEILSKYFDDFLCDIKTIGYGKYSDHVTIYTKGSYNFLKDDYSSILFKS